MSAANHPYDLVVAGLHLRWDGVWQRPHHLLSRIARDVPVIVVEEPMGGDRDHDAITTRGSVTIVTPRRTGKPQDALDARTLQSVRDRTDGRRVVVWLYTPMMLALADAYPGAPIVFDKMDDLAQFAFADPRLADRERRLLRRARCVFTGGRSLQRSVEATTPHARCYPSGVDLLHFSGARERVVDAALAARRGHPVLGYVGVIDERLDLRLIAGLADTLPDALIAMVGPVVKIDPRALPLRPNIAYLGPRRYEQLPAVLAGFDVALMPFARNAHTAKISPTKTLEYLAAGLPVVSTAVPDVVAEHADVALVADDPASFAALVAQALRPDLGRRERGFRKAAAAGWDTIAAAMRADLEAAGVRLAVPAAVT
ncbi:MAG: glycosyltransferase [Candidatus Eremiobacteraeota bacterium]|nr:glycosyltransferase [Candidatus Eremiobacteraeota bacterium]